ncbi:hypothetical protein P7K49_020660, partial [Saguinus oedipus]
ASEGIAEPSQSPPDCPSRGALTPDVCSKSSRFTGDAGPGCGTGEGAVGRDRSAAPWQGSQAELGTEAVCG